MLTCLNLTFNLSQEFSQKSEYSKSSTLWDGMGNEQSSETEYLGDEALDKNKTWIWTAITLGYRQYQVESIYVFIYYIYLFL